MCSFPNSKVSAAQSAWSWSDAVTVLGFFIIGLLLWLFMWFWREVTAWKSTPKNGGEGGRSKREGEETTRAEKQREDQREKKKNWRPPPSFLWLFLLTRQSVTFWVCLSVSQFFMTSFWLSYKNRQLPSERPHRTAVEERRIRTTRRKKKLMKELQ